MDPKFEEKKSLPTPEYTSKVSSVSVIIPPYKYLSVSEIKNLEGNYGKGLEKIAARLRKKYKMKKKFFIEKTFSKNIQTLSNKKELDNVIKEHEIVESNGSKFHYRCMIPSNHTSDEFQELKDIPIAKLKKRINFLYTKCKSRAKKSGETFTLTKFVRTFSNIELMSNKEKSSMTPESIAASMNRAKNLEAYCSRELEKVEKNYNVKEKKRDQERTTLRDTKEDRLLEATFFREVVAPPEMPTPKKVSRRAKLLEERNQRKFANLEIRKANARRKAYKKAKAKEQKANNLESKSDKMEVSEPAKESVAKSQVGFGKSKNNLSKSELEKRIHDRKMKQRRLFKKKKREQVETIAKNKQQRRNKGKTSNYSTESGPLLTSLPTEELKSGFEDCDEEIEEDDKNKEAYATIAEAFREIKEHNIRHNKELGSVIKRYFNDFDEFTYKHRTLIDLVMYIHGLSMVTSVSSLINLSYLYLSTWGISPLKCGALSVFLGASSQSLANLVTSLTRWREDTGFTTEAGEDVVFEGFSPSRIFDTIISWGSRFFTSDVYLSLKKFILTLLSFGFFEKEQAKDISYVIGKPKKNMSLLDGAQDILTSASQLLRSGEMLVRGYPIEECFFSKDPLTVYIKKCQVWQLSLPLVVQGIPPEGKIRINDHIAEGDKILTFFRATKPKLNALAPNYDEAIKCLTKMEVALPLLKTQVQSRSRATPLAICIVSPPGFGKSTILKIILKIYCEVMGYEYDQEMVYHRTPSSEYWENFDSYIHKAIHISEIGSKSDAIMLRGDPAIAELTSVIDSMPYPVPMAFENKGKVFCLADLVLIDTNNEEMGIKIIQKNPTAFYRRFLYIRPTVRPEFQKDGSNMLDANKHVPGISYIDKWFFDVYTKVPQNEKNYLTHTILDKVTLPIFAKGLHSYMKTYFTQEAEVQHKSDAALGDIETILKEVKDPNYFDDTNSESTCDHSDEDKWDDNPYSTESDGVDFLNAGPLVKFWLDSVPTVKREKFFFRETLRRWFNTGTTVFVDTLDLMSSAFSLSGAGFNTYYRKDNVRNILNIEMWICWFLLGLLLAQSLGSIGWIISIFLVFNQSPFSILTAWNSATRYMDAKKEFRMKFSKLKKTVSLGMDDILVMPVHSNALSLMAISLGAIGVLKMLSLSSTFVKRRRKRECQSEASDHLERKNAEIDKLCEVSNAKIRIRNKVDSWNVISGDVPLHTSDSKSLYKKVLRNVKECKVIIGNRTRNTHILGVCGNVAIINTHALCGQSDFEIMFKINNVPNSGWVRTHITPEFHTILSNDVTLVVLSGVQFCDISSHIKPLPQVTHTSGYYMNDSVSKLHHEKSNLYVKDSFTDIILSDYWKFQGKHKSGQCGFPLLAEVQGGVSLVGIHSAGGDKDDTIICCSILDDIKTEIVHLTRKSALLPISSESHLGLHFKPKVNVKSATRFEDTSSFKFFGSLDKVVLANQKSKLKRTEFYNTLHENLYQAKGFIPNESYGRPHLSSFHDKDGKWVSPYNNNLRKINKPRGFANKRRLRTAIEVYAKRVISMLKKRGVVLSPLPIDEAVNGAAQDYYARPIDMSKSAGFGLDGKKRNHFIKKGDKYELKDELMEKVIHIKEEYLKGNSVPAIFVATPKDEPRLTEKIDKGGTRIFFAGPTEHLVVAKQYLGPFLSLMSEHRDAFCCAIGIDAHREGEWVSEFLSCFSKNKRTSREHLCDDVLMVEGDYKGYDVSMCPDISWAGVTFIHMVCEALGYNEEALKILRSLLSDMMHPYLEFLGDLFMAIITASGMLGTAELNSIKGVIIAIYNFLSKSGTEHLDPFDYIRPLTYGDDVLISVNPKTAWYNNQYYARMCEEELGMVFTSATKGEHASSFVSFKEATFLRRSFIEKGGRIRMPLTLNSAEKTVGWMIPSREASVQDQMWNSFSSFLREVYLQSDQIEFDQLKQWGEQILEQHYDCPRPLPTYEEILISIDGDYFTTESKLVTEEERGDLDELCENIFDSECSWQDFRSHYPIATIMVGWMITYHHFGGNMGDSFEVFNWPAALKEYLSTRVYAMREELKELSEERPPGYDLLSNLTRSDIISTRRYGTDKRYKNMCDTYLDHKGKVDALRLSINVLERTLRMESTFTAESADGYLAADSVSEVKTENLGDMGGAPMIINEQQKSRYVNVGQKAPLEISNFLRRPVRIGAYDNTPGTPLNESINPWDAYLSQPSVRAKLRNTAFIKGDLRLRIVTSGMPSHYGRYLYSYLPFPTINQPWQHLLASTASGVEFGRLVYLSQTPYSKTVDVTSNAPIELRIPYLSPQPAIRLFNNSTVVLAGATAFSDVEDLGVLYLKSINTLQATSPTPSSVSIAVYAWLENVEFGYPTGTQLEVTTESDERIVGPISSATKSMSEAMKAAENVPVIGSYAKASSQVLRGVSDIASAIGWSYPTLIDDPMRMKNEPFQNAVTTIGMDTGKRLVLDPKQELSVDPRIAGSDSDDLVISNIVKREALLSTFTWGASDTSLSGPIKVVAVTPMCAEAMATGITPGSKVYILHTPLSFAATPFHFWRGEITYRVEFVCSLYHRGKIIIGYEPNIRQQTLIDTVLDTNKNYITTVDLQQTRCIEFTVKWANPRPWLEVSPISEFISPGTAEINLYDQFEKSNGYVFFTPLTKLQSPDNSDIQLNLYVRSHNMKFNCYDTDRLPAEYTAESELSDCNPSDLVILNPSNATDDNLCNDYFGEIPLSFRSLLRRFETSGIWNTIHAAGLSRIVGEMRVIPRPEPNFGDDADTYTTVAGIFTYLRYAYLAMRGGIRKRVYVRNRQGVPTDIVTVALRYDNGRQYASVVTGAAAPRIKATGTALYVPHTNAGVEFEIPWYTCSTWGFAQTADYLPAKSYVSQKTTSRYTLQYGTSNPTSYAVELGECSAIGEDFSFMNFIAAYPQIGYTVS